MAQNVGVYDEDAEPNRIYVDAVLARAASFNRVADG